VENIKRYAMYSVVAVVLVAIVGVYFRYFFTEEAQNKISRKITSTIGITGKLDIYDNGKVVQRFLKIDKLSTAYGTHDNQPRPYRYGYGFNDKNLNGILDDSEKRVGKVYFEFSEFNRYIFMEDK
jgi:hypothetical protein